MKNKDKFTKIAFVLNGLLFLMGGITLIEDSKASLGIIQLLASMFNFIMIFKIRKKSSLEILNYTLLALNVVVCLSIAIDYIFAGKQFIQYAWIIAAFVSLIALLLQIKKKKRFQENS